MLLDLKLGARMLVKYPGLTIVGGLAMAFAIAVGTVIFAVVSQLVHPTLPLPGGDRIVQIRDWDAATGDVEQRSLHDYVIWRSTLRSITDIGAWRDLSSNLITPGGDARTISVAELTAAAFRIAPARPLLGRVLSADDERAGAPPVIVLGYDVWRTRFAADSGVIGRSVQLGDARPTIVGVMPEGFRFPVSHDAWIPLHSDVLNQLPRQGPPVTVFGRLAPGVSLDQAQVELSGLGQRIAAQFPKAYEHLQPQVVPYAKSYMDPTPGTMPIMFAINVFAVMLLVLVCGNVALLLFARAASRETELAVRSALGATRQRIVIQLFAEALVLGAAATVVGLGAAHIVLERWGVEFLEQNLGPLPFWYDIRISMATVCYACGLTLLGAAIAGVLPALKITRGFGQRLRQGAAGAGGPQFGGVWTAVIIAQVAFTVAFPSLAWVEQRELLHIESFPAGFAAEQYLSARLDMDTTTGTRFAAALERVRQRVAAEPGVLGVTFVDRLPRTGHVERNIELDESSSATPVGADGAAPLREVSTARVDASYFDVLHAPILAGRDFRSDDLTPGARAVIVDRSFVDQVLRGRNAVGRRVRLARQQRGGVLPDSARPWYQIVGVVNELGMGAPTQHNRAAGLYLPTTPGSAGATTIVVHLRGDPLLFGPRLRALATTADPALRLSELQRVDQVTSAILWIVQLWLRVTLLLSAIALILSLAGIYSVLSFTVARRTREIGVRIALGATPRRVVSAIFRRPLTQVTLGVATGGTVIVLAALARMTLGDTATGVSISAGQIGLLLGYAAFMWGVCLLACVVPTRRALHVQPTEALRAE